MAASKLVPRKEKRRVLGVQNDFQNNLAFLGVRLIITVSINFVCVLFLFLYIMVTGQNVRLGR